MWTGWENSRFCSDVEIQYKLVIQRIEVCWRVNIDSLEAKKLACLTLPPSKHRWVTTVSMLHCPTHPFLILCGDRKGSLHLYQLTPGDGEWHDPYQTLQGVHGPNGVTYSCFHDNTVYTCGRNGLCRKYQLGEDGKLTELTKFKVRIVLLPGSVSMCLFLSQ